MAVEVTNLDMYDILQLQNGEEYKILHNGYGLGSDIMFVRLFPENHSLEDLEKSFLNPNNTKRMLIMDQSKQDVKATRIGFTVIENIQKEFQGAYHIGIDDEGEQIILTTDVYVINFRKPTAQDLLPKFQSDLEYVAIMSDIDIDTDEE